MTNNTTTTRRHPSVYQLENWNETLKSLEGKLTSPVTNITPVNFSNGKTSFREQNYDLSVVKDVYGYTTNLWATAKQIAAMGGTVVDGAVEVPIFMEKKSRKTGSTWYSVYKVVNLDCVQFPNGISDETAEAIRAAYAKRTTYKTTKGAMPKPVHAAEIIPLNATTHTTLPDFPADDVRETNALNPRHKTDGTDGNRSDNVTLEYDFDGVHFTFTARTTDELEIMRKRAIKGYIHDKVALAKAMASVA